MDCIIDEKNNNLKKTPLPYKNKQDYDGGTNYKTRKSDDSPSDTDGCARNIDDEQKNEEDDEYIDPPSEKNDIIKSKLEEYVRNSLLAKKIPLKLIKAVIFTIDNHEKYILAVGYENKTIKTQ